MQYINLSDENNTENEDSNVGVDTEELERISKEIEEI